MIKKIWLFPIIYGLFSLVFILLIGKNAFPIDVIIKPIPVLSLSYWIFRDVKGFPGKMLGIAMLLSAAGDVVLGMPGPDVLEFFVLGLGLFLCAHILFIICFLSGASYQNRSLPVLILVPLFSISMSVLLAPHLKDLAVPVFVYISVISVMGISAALNQRGGIMLMLGAGFFILSDTGIAVNKFLFAEPLAFAPYFIMITYYLAQYLIAKSFLNTEKFSENIISNSIPGQNRI